jgi:hypothetical protein
MSKQDNALEVWLDDGIGSARQVGMLARAREDFDYVEFAEKGGLQKAWGLFGKELDRLITEMNEELVA